MKTRSFRLTPAIPPAARPHRRGAGRTCSARGPVRNACRRADLVGAALPHRGVASEGVLDIRLDSEQAVRDVRQRSIPTEATPC